MWPTMVLALAPLAVLTDGLEPSAGAAGGRAA
jgi:hypothetical protein